MLSVLLAVPVSVGLLIWILRMKQYNPFPKFTFVKLLIAGAIALLLSGIITIIGGIINLLIQIGPEQLKLMTDAESAVKILEEISEAAKVITPERMLMGFIRTFILIGFTEEFLKFICAKVVMRKEGVVYTWMDALLCFAVVAVSFQLFEDMGYSSGNIVLAIFRALTPFHFTFAVFMGYFYGLGKVKGNGFYTILALVVPALIHTLYDFSISLLQRDDNFIFLNLGMNAVMLVLTVLAVLKLRKWHREGTLDIFILSTEKTPFSIERG